MAENERFLIVGIPGMGKTTIGNFLQKEKYFIHIDMENEGYTNISKIIANPKFFIENAITQNKHLVVTWGFPPTDNLINIVNLFKDYGFQIIWLDGDKEAAKKEFTRRDGERGEKYLKEQLKALEFQLHRINISNVVNRINPKIINTFTLSHQFKKLEEIYQEIKNV